MIKYQCPECGGHIETAEDVSCEADVCPACGALVRVPFRPDRRLADDKTEESRGAAGAPSAAWPAP